MEGKKAERTEGKVSPPGADEHAVDEGDVGIHLSYTFNLNLPPTADIAVFNAIFKALRDNLLKK